MTQSTLYTERLQLVPLSDAHLELEIALDAGPEVMRYLTGRALSRAEVKHAHQRRIAAAREVPGLGFWAGLAAGEFVGWWILQPPHGPDQPEVAEEADLGYRLMRRHWRRGYASEGARELIRYGFDDLGLNPDLRPDHGGQHRRAGNHECRRAQPCPRLHLRPLRRSGSRRRTGRGRVRDHRSTWQRNRAAGASGVPQ
jgi:RimJ/RimL family protein N-acetyltransferase